ncbi:hypothetical protein LTR97_010257 [Elasticomyces elasticus]|uniref:DUF6594 domain-containing protein n=1 Tax=Elasticomyces elasticus TaxID=574655 RepID=A0AAN7W4G6_9PEZI|nr:hypothetical protein LTR97_010257 [Elasticomyces elasticus]
MATVQASVPAFMQFRRFGYLHMRMLLALQQEIVGLESELEELDTTGRQSAPEVPELLLAIESKVLRYDRLLLHARETNLLPSPLEVDYDVLKSWVSEEDRLAKDGADWLNHKSDIISLSQEKPQSLLAAGMRNLWQCSPARLQSLFISPENRQDNHVLRDPSARLQVLHVVLVTASIFLLLMLPILALYQLDLNSGTHAGSRVAVALGILLFGSVAFAATLAVTMTFRGHEVLAMSAAYCAVVVVFASNFIASPVP